MSGVVGSRAHARLSDGDQWRHHAACHGTNPDDWFPPKATDLKEIRRLKQICGNCAAKVECLTFALEHDQAGIWGGLTEKERKRLKNGEPSADSPLAPCGTPAAFRRHIRHGEPVDDACREAWNAAQRDWYASKKSAAS